MSAKKENKKQKDIKKYNEEIGEDTTKYAEFISSYFGWISLESQKENVKKLENITKKKEKER